MSTPDLASGSFAADMMNKMGWTPGMGLGLNSDGVKEAVKVKRKPDKLGLGAKRDSDWGDDWWQRGFENAIRKSCATDTVLRKGESAPEDAKEAGMDEVLLNACEGRRCRATGHGKLRRVEKQEKALQNRLKDPGSTKAPLTARKASKKKRSKRKVKREKSRA